MTKGEVRKLWADYPGVLHKIGISLTDFSHDDEEFETYTEEEIEMLIHEMVLKEWTEEIEEPISFGDEDEEEEERIEEEWDGELSILAEEGF